MVRNENEDQVDAPQLQRTHSRINGEGLSPESEGDGSGGCARESESSSSVGSSSLDGGMDGFSVGSRHDDHLRRRKSRIEG